MYFKIMGLNWQHTVLMNRKLKETPRLAMFVLADKCKDFSDEIEVGVEKLAWLLNLSEKQTKRVLRGLQKENFIQIHSGNGRGNLTKIKLLLPQIKGDIGEQRGTPAPPFSSKKGDIKGGHSEQKGAIKGDIGDDKGGHSHTRAYKDLFTTEEEEKDTSSSAAEVAEEVFEMTLPIHVGELLAAENISDLTEFRQILTARKLRMTADQFTSATYKQTALSFAVQDYHKAITAKEQTPAPPIQFWTPPELEKPYWNPQEKAWFIPNSRPEFRGIRDSRFAGKDGCTMEQSLVEVFGMTMEEIKNAQTASARN